ncbi:MAG: hypothetical protein OEY20_16600 [Gemmatimonadota bacterium]|nr:hypothetical protein [Gemmatimonadota bacterium]MDH5198863.1 hypothetical protein [Gemmatimonadota bacterium]
MFYEEGCHGRVTVGSLPDEVVGRLATLPGEWLEFDPPLGAIVVRHIQPTAAPTLPTIVAELVRMLAEIPVALHAQITGGEFSVHTEDSPHLVRIRVGEGGGVRVDWARPDFAKGRKQPYTDGSTIPIDGVYCRLNGSVTFRAADPARAAREIQQVADTYEGLYPEGDFRAGPGAESGTADVAMRDVNLDPRLLVARLSSVAEPGSLRGTVEVRSFDDRHPDDRVRLVFQDGQTWVQEPYFFPETPATR